jgi:hypothetical protein
MTVAAAFFALGLLVLIGGQLFLLLVVLVKEYLG